MDTMQENIIDLCTGDEGKRLLKALRKAEAAAIYSRPDGLGGEELLELYPLRELIDLLTDGTG